MSFFQGNGLYGLLLENKDPLQAHNLPTRRHAHLDTVLPSDGKDYLVAGDMRCPEQPGLLIIHTIFFLEHNRIATILSESQPMKAYLETKARGNDRLKSDIIYKLTRKILVACYQHIVYNDYLPAVLGDELMSEFDLWPSYAATSDYDENVDATLTNEFSTFAYR